MKYSAVSIVSVYFVTCVENCQNIGEAINCGQNRYILALYLGIDLL